MPPTLASPFRRDILKGRNALITGGSSGIGLQISRELGAHGATVTIMGRRAGVASAAAETLRAEGIAARYVVGDVRKTADVLKALAEATHGSGEDNKLHILVNCAAGNFLTPAEQLSPNGFRTVMEIDTQGVFNVSRACFESMKRTDWTPQTAQERLDTAVIINISATLHYGATWYQAHASAAKAAIDSLTRSLALEWGGYGIRTVGIAPGPIRGTAGMTKLAPGMQSTVAATVPVGRMGETSDIALSAVYLCSDAGAYVNGETIVVDGGAWFWKQPIAPREQILNMSKRVERKSRDTGVAKL